MQPRVEGGAADEEIHWRGTPGLMASSPGRNTGRRWSSSTMSASSALPASRSGRFHVGSGKDKAISYLIGSEGLAVTACETGDDFLGLVMEAGGVRWMRVQT